MYHPDVYTGNDASARTAEVVAAFKILSDPGARARLDQHLDNEKVRAAAGNRAPPPPSPPPKAAGPSPSDSSTEGSFGQFSRAAGTLVVLVGLAAMAFASQSGGDEDPYEAAMADNVELPSDGWTYSASEYDTTAETVEDAAAAAEEAARRTEVSGLDSLSSNRALPFVEEPLSFADVEGGAKHFFSVLTRRGISRTREESENCHQKANSDPTFENIDRCAAFDFAAFAYLSSSGNDVPDAVSNYFAFQTSNQSDYYSGRYYANSRVSKIRNSARPIIDSLVQGHAASATSASSQAPPAEKRALARSLGLQVKPHWSVPSGLDSEKLVTVVAFNLNQDGSLAGPVRIVRQEGVTPTNEAQAALHAERAVRAVRLAAPFQLPVEQYSAWRSVSELRLDSRS